MIRVAVFYRSQKMASAGKAKLGGTLVDLGGFVVELPTNTPLAFQNAFELETFIKISYPKIACDFNKVKACLTLSCVLDT